MQDYPGAPGTARQGRTRIIVSTNDGGVATQPRAPGHERPRAASSDAARHGRPRATPRAPGADIPPATPAGAPGQHRLRAVPPAPDHDRSCTRHQRAPGHGRPLAALSATRHDRPCATPRAPGADVPLATTARAPGQHRPSAVAIATVALPAGQHRLRQEGLPRVPANPRTLTHPQSHHTVSSLRLAPQSNSRPAADRRTDSRSLPGKGLGDRSKLHHTWHYPCGFGLSGVRSNPLPNEKPTLISRPSPADSAHPTTHQVHPAIQVPPHPQSCSTAATGLFAQHPSRAPPSAPAENLPVPTPSPPRHMVERGPGGGAQPHHTWQYPCGCAPSKGAAPLPRGGAIGGPTMLPLYPWERAGGCGPLPVDGAQVRW